MGKPRIRGQHVKLTIKSGTDVIDIGEITKLTVKELGELKKSRSIGESQLTSVKTFEGYDLSFEGGKVDWRLAQLMHAQEEKIVNNKRSPYFSVTQTFTYYGTDNTDTYVYPEVTIHGYTLDIDATDELTEKFEGYCGVLRVRTAPGGLAVSSVATTMDNAIAAALAADATFNGV